MAMTMTKAYLEQGVHHAAPSYNVLLHVERRGGSGEACGWVMGGWCGGWVVGGERGGTWVVGGERGGMRVVGGERGGMRVMHAGG